MPCRVCGERLTVEQVRAYSALERWVECASCWDAAHRLPEPARMREALERLAGEETMTSGRRRAIAAQGLGRGDDYQ